jgi:uncharacterized protein YndB with AHSA1/START domain
MRRPSACGSCGPIRASSSAGGARRTAPATVTQHNQAPAGRVEYGMMGPQGDRHRGYWDILEAEAPHRLMFRDGLASADGTPSTDMSLTMTRVTIEEVDVGRTRTSIVSRFPGVEAMEWILTTGTDEGRTRAVGQIDAILAEDALARHRDLSSSNRRRRTLRIRLNIV